MTILSVSDLILSDVVVALQQGKTIVYPTETCYGLGCDARSQDAIAKIYHIKQRRQDKPLLAVVASVEMAMEFVKWNSTIEKLAKRFWPGPLTIVSMAKAANSLARGVIDKYGQVALRVTSSPLAANLSAELNGPLVSTSANLASHNEPYNIVDVVEMFTLPPKVSEEVKSQQQVTPLIGGFIGKVHQPDIIIDAGKLPKSSLSTIVRIVGEKIEVIRQGAINVHHAIS